MGLAATLVHALAVAVVASAASSSLASSTLQEPAPIQTTLLYATPSPTPTGQPACAMASSAAVAYMSANPERVNPIIPAELAYNCLQSVPNEQAPALQLLQGMAPFIEFQSTLAYLKNPPPGYLFPPVDVAEGLAEIAANVAEGAYMSEYDFQTDIQALLISAKDDHLSFAGDVTGVFSFLRTVSLVSASLDGAQIPQVFVIDDLVNATATGIYPRSVSFTPSPITMINSIDIATFAEAQSVVGTSQDPDALYNQVFVNLASFAIGEASSTFQAPIFYPGPTTNLTFANGTSITLPNEAQVLKNLTDVIDGGVFYSSFCIPASTESVPATTTVNQETQPTSTAPATSSPVSSLPAVPTSPGYPFPVVKHSGDVVSGYFLNSTEFQNVAVLAIPSFSPALGAEVEFQAVIESFLAEAKQAGKTKLIIDLQANGGGIVPLGIDTFAQLFPSFSPPLSQGNFRASEGTNLFGQGITDGAAIAIEKRGINLTAADEAYLFLPYSAFSELKPDGTEFSSWSELFGPISLNNDNFTNLAQDNQSAVLVPGLVVTGTNNRTGFTQPFAAEDMILVYDGKCASTCAVFSELIKNFGGVQAIAVGGRPQLGPMQGVGGVKGSRVFDYQTIVGVGELAFAGLAASGSNELLAQANETFGAIENLRYAISRSGDPTRGGTVNIINNIRVGDNSITPLQFVYEAADCRIWYTKEMLSDPNFLWSRVAGIALNNNGTRFSSPLCIAGSTNQPTSLSGGGTNRSGIGPQTPPAGAESSVAGGLVNGTVVMSGFGGSPREANGATGSDTTGTGSGEPVRFTGGAEKKTVGWVGSLLPFIIAAVVGAVAS